MATTSSVESLRQRRISKLVATLSLFIVFVIVGLIQFQCSVKYVSMDSKNKFKSRTILSASHRKLLQQGEGEATKGVEQPNRIWRDRSCSSDIVVSQGPTAPMPNGIPTYTVEIANVCVTRCNISGIHLHCGWFSSARLINPRIFKRLKFDDCLVNNVHC